jgi:hypothetical protein
MANAPIANAPTANAPNANAPAAKAPADSAPVATRFDTTTSAVGIPASPVVELCARLRRRRSCLVRLIPNRLWQGAPRVQTCDKFVCLMIQLVWIDVPGGGFAATVNLSVDSLNANAMPTQLEGTFLSYGVEADENEQLVHAQRRNDGSDPIMYFDISKEGYGFSKHGYRFHDEVYGWRPL